MKFSRSIVLAVALIFAWATAGFAAHSVEICQKRIESFNYLVDYSGSMMMNFPSVGKTKMAVAKEVIKRVNAVVPDLGYQGGLYTFAPYGAVVNQGPWVPSTLAAGVDSLKDNLETFARFTPMGDGIQAHNGIISQMTPRAAVILVSDGESNRGISAIDEVKAIYAANPNVCFHVISCFAPPEARPLWTPSRPSTPAPSPSRPSTFSRATPPSTSSWAMCSARNAWPSLKTLSSSAASISPSTSMT